MACSGGVLSIGRRMGCRPEASPAAPCRWWRQRAKLRCHDTIIARGEPQLSSLRDDSARVSRHQIWLSRYLYDCTNKMVLSTKKRLGWRNRGPQDGPKSIILK